MGRQFLGHRARARSDAAARVRDEADLDFTDFARYLLDDPDTRVIAGFVKGFKEAD